MDNSESLMPRQNNDGRRKLLVSFIGGWLAKLAAAYRQEMSLETQAMYLDGLSDLPMERLDEAFRRAVRECKFLPSIAEIRQLESSLQVPEERMQEAHERLRQRLANQPEQRYFKSVLGPEQKALNPSSVVQLSEDEWKQRLEKLAGQHLRIIKGDEPV